MTGQISKLGNKIWMVKKWRIHVHAIKCPICEIRAGFECPICFADVTNRNNWAIARQCFQTLRKSNIVELFRLKAAFSCSTA